VVEQTHPITQAQAASLRIPKQLRTPDEQTRSGLAHILREIPALANDIASEDKDGRTVAASLKAGVAYITKAIEFLQSTEPQDQAARP